MLQLSFKEYSSIFKSDNYQQLFSDYMKNGGMPSTINVESNEIDKYLNGIFSTVICKNVISRNKITDKILLENILKFIFDSIGSPISTKKLAIQLLIKAYLLVIIQLKII